MICPPSKGYKILNAEPGRFSEFCREELRQLGSVKEVECDRKALKENIVDCDVVVTMLKNTFDAEVLNLASRLKCIVTPTTGLNHIDLELAEKKNVTVLSLQGEKEFLKTISATAELTWGLLLSLARQIPSACQSVHSGNWTRNDFIGTELKGKTLGILGCGRLGEKVARYGLAFDMNVIACDPYIQDAPFGVELVSIEELFALSDVLSIHVPLNTETKTMIGRKLFSRLKQGVLLINTSRGEVLDEDALLEELKSSRIAGFGCDVLTNEFSADPNWLKNSRLFQFAQKHKNTLITPHIGGLTTDSAEATTRFIIEKLKNHLINICDGESPLG